MREQYCQSEGLPFSEISNDDELQDTFNGSPENSRDRIFTPAVTLAAFIQQTMNSDGQVKKIKKGRGKNGTTE
jgi:hypothetical protein